MLLPTDRLLTRRHSFHILFSFVVFKACGLKSRTLHFIWDPALYCYLPLAFPVHLFNTQCISSSSSSYGSTAHSGPGLRLWGFVTITFLQGWIVTPEPNPQPGGSGLRIYDPPGTGWPSYTPRHWVPILVAFYDMHGLHTVGLFFNLDHHTVHTMHMHFQMWAYCQITF
jgi:hypothetical protein